MSVRDTADQKALLAVYTLQVDAHTNLSSDVLHVLNRIDHDKRLTVDTRLFLYARVARQLLQGRSRK